MTHTVQEVHSGDVISAVAGAEYLIPANSHNITFIGNPLATGDVIRCEGDNDIGIFLRNMLNVLVTDGGDRMVLLLDHSLGVSVNGLPGHNHSIVGLLDTGFRNRHDMLNHLSVQQGPLNGASTLKAPDGETLAFFQGDTDVRHNLIFLS